MTGSFGKDDRMCTVRIQCSGCGVVGASRALGANRAQGGVLGVSINS